MMRGGCALVPRSALAVGISRLTATDVMISEYSPTRTASPETLLSAASSYPCVGTPRAMAGYNYKL